MVLQRLSVHRFPRSGTQPTIERLSKKPPSRGIIRSVFIKQTSLSIHLCQVIVESLEGSHRGALTGTCDPIGETNTHEGKATKGQKRKLETQSES